MWSNWIRSQMGKSIKLQHLLSCEQLLQLWPRRSVAASPQRPLCAPSCPWIFLPQPLWQRSPSLQDFCYPWPTPPLKSFKIYCSHFSKHFKWSWKGRRNPLGWVPRKGLFEQVHLWRHQVVWRGSHRKMGDETPGGGKRPVVGITPAEWGQREGGWWDWAWRNVGPLMWDL
jgi:hypothetical protein